jgi:hypothetical protein
MTGDGERPVCACGETAVRVSAKCGQYKYEGYVCELCEDWHFAPTEPEAREAFITTQRERESE